MVQVGQMPDPEELKKRREKKYLVNPKDVTKKDEMRIRAWAGEIMRENEHRLDKKVADKKIVWSGEVKPEAIDIKNIYPFPDLNWIIYRNGICWNFMLKTRGAVLANITYAQL